MRTLRPTLVLAALFLLALGPGTASAAQLAFIEQGDSTFVQHDSSFQCGIVVTAPGGENAHVDACWFTNSPVGYSGVATAYMVEPAGTPEAGALSDRIHIQFNVTTDATGQSIANMSIDFISDPDIVPPEFPPPNVPVLVEDGQLQLLNTFFVDQSGTPLPPPTGIEILALSDVNDRVTPTDPTTWGNVKALYR